MSGRKKKIRVRETGATAVGEKKRGEKAPE
jgi:hypothetical protein